MTYTANETSVESGAPIILYKFQLGSDFFFYTSAEDDQLVSGDTYSAIEISHTGLKFTSEQRSGLVTLTVKSNNAFASNYIGIQPSNFGLVTISRFHRFDTPTPEIVELFEGRVRSVAFFNQGFSAKIAAMPLTEALSQTIPKNTFQNPCNWILGSAFCKVNLNDFNFGGTVTVISGDGLTLTIPGLDAGDPLVTFKGAGWAKSGKVTITSNNDVRLIIDHTATDQVKILLPFPSSPVGSAVVVTAGCPHVIAACKADFDNVLNYGGHAFVPLENVFQKGLD